MTNEDILQIFFQECEEALSAAEQGLIDCREGNADDETVNCIFRSVHSIKGGAGAFGFTALQAFTHKFETVLSFVRDGVLPLNDNLNNLMLRAFDLLADHCTAARGEGSTPDDAIVSAELEAQSFAAENGGGAAAEEAAADDTGAADIDLDFDLDSLIGAIDSDEGDAVIADIAAADAASASEWLVDIKPLAGSLKNGSEPLLLVREVALLGGRCVSVNTDRIPPLAEFDPEETYVVWRFAIPAEVTEAQIREIFDFVGDDVEIRVLAPTSAEAAVAAAPEPAPAPVAAPTPVAEPVKAEAPQPVEAPVAVPAPTPVKAEAPKLAAAPAEKKVTVAAGQTIRVDLAKLDRLIDTVGELVIAQAMMAQRLADLGMAGVDELGMLDQLTRELQDSAMSIRAQPIGSVFSRVPRIVRELEAETGKRVRVEVSGEATELDKTVVERLGEPLTHLIRNAVDHGLELPEVREAAGKPGEGVLRLSAEHRSGKILISIADDGAGINRERVFAKAVEKGLIPADAQLTNEEIDNLIFAPGFSTAATISNISGRGVGMDVVRQNVKDLGGRISIQSTPGQGSIFTLALPLTLAISDGMIVSVGDQTLVVPLTHVVESLRPEAGDLRPMGNGRNMLNVRGTFLPIIPVDTQLRAIGAVTKPEESVLIVVETENSGSAVLQVDNILDQRQFVIKSLESNYKPVPCVAGATILGDGKVALILDVDMLVGSVVGSVSGLRLVA
ncbi:MAG: chemotaxis protein CheA [Sphingobium sp.]|nr:chemotaxis protein CheA [Sphingobium sp.]